MYYEMIIIWTWRGYEKFSPSLSPKKKRARSFINHPQLSVTSARKLPLILYMKEHSPCSFTKTAFKHTHTHSARVVSLSPFCSSDYFCSHYWWFFFPLPTFWLETLTWLRICTLNSCVESQGESYVMWCVLESELKLIDNSMNTLLLGLTWLKVIMLTHW